MKLDKKQIQHIANLARLELSDKELKKYGEHISQILNYIDQLQEVDTTGIEPTAQVTGLENALREDSIEVWNNNERTAALKEAPELKDEQIKVKRVLK